MTGTTSASEPPGSAPLRHRSLTAVEENLRRRPLFSRRLVINMGKGGVGKSAVSAAMALLAQRRGLKVLLVQLDARDRISEYLGSSPVTQEVNEVLPGLDCVNISPEAALREYVLLQVRLEAIYKLVFKNRFVSAFLKAVPALSDLVMLGKVEYHLRQTGPGGAPLYDLVIVDPPPTGHGMFFLKTPFVMADAARSGPIREHSLRMAGLLSDQARCAINLVTLPEEMPVAETIDACADLSWGLNIIPHLLLVNRYTPSPYREDEQQVIRQVLRGVTDLKREALLSVVGQDMDRARLRDAHVAALDAQLGMQRLCLPELVSERFGRDEVERLCAVMEEAL